MLVHQYIYHQLPPTFGIPKTIGFRAFRLLHRSFCLLNQLGCDLFDLSRRVTQVTSSVSQGKSKGQQTEEIYSNDIVYS